MDVNIASLAHDVTVALVPVLPYLSIAGGKALEKAGEKITEGVWARGQALWNKLWPKVEHNTAALGAAKDLANMPDDNDAQAAMRLQLKKLLTEDSTFAQEIAKTFAELAPSNTTVIASGDRSVASQNMTDNVIITGDSNAVQK